MDDRRQFVRFKYPPGPHQYDDCDCSLPILPMDNSCDVYCKKLTLPPPPPMTVPIATHKHYRLPIFLTVAIVVLATAFFFFTCYTVYRFYTCWRRSPRRRPAADGGVEEFIDEDRGPVVDHPIWYIRTVGLDAAVIEAITVVRYKKGEDLIDGTDCSVCLSEFQEDEALRLLPKCSHAFHLPCIDTWLRSHTNCPMCRARILVNCNTPAAPTPVTDPNPDEMRITVEPETESSEVLQQQQPMRRSVSLDSMSALSIQNAVQRQLDRDSDKELIEEQGEINSNGGVNELSVQRGQSSAVKRSLSCSAKVFLARHSSRSRNSQQ